MWGPAKMTRQDPPRPATPPTTRHLSRDQGRGKKGATRHFSKCSLIKDYFKKLISQNRRAKLASSLLQCQSSPISFLRAVRRENVSDIVTRAMYVVKSLSFSPIQQKYPLLEIPPSEFAPQRRKWGALSYLYLMLFKEIIYIFCKLVLL